MHPSQPPQHKTRLTDALRDTRPRSPSSMPVTSRRLAPPAVCDGKFRAPRSRRTHSSRPRRRPPSGPAGSGTDGGRSVMPSPNGGPDNFAVFPCGRAPAPLLADGIHQHQPAAALGLSARAYPGRGCRGRIPDQDQDGAESETSHSRTGEAICREAATPFATSSVTTSSLLSARFWSPSHQGHAGRPAVRTGRRPARLPAQGSRTRPPASRARLGRGREGAQSVRLCGQQSAHRGWAANRAALASVHACPPMPGFT